MKLPVDIMMATPLEEDGDGDMEYVAALWDWLRFAYAEVRENLNIGARRQAN